LWSSEQLEAWRPIVKFIHDQQSLAGIQLAHAGRKASTKVPWQSGPNLISPANGGWMPLAPSPIPFFDSDPAPREMNHGDIEKVVSDFASSAKRALEAGFDVIELHMAHGYLVHQFLSPLSNHRNDEYGGSFENRTRLAIELARAVRKVWPESRPLFARFSCTDWVEGGWDLAQSVELAKLLKREGVDLIDCSSGALVPYAKIKVGPGYQVPFAAELRAKAQIATAAVGLITQAEQAEAILQEGQADAVFLARAFLRDPYWPLHAAKILGEKAAWPVQYGRAE
jgi:2,4-dienoyl-CoA reductase-like NADH-dependent reductase (Old Yellow Enzyme family)